MVGVPDDQVLTIMDAISNAITDSCEPLIIPDISMRDIDGKTVIVAEILPGAQRPYFESMARLDEQQRKVLDMLVQNGPMKSSSIADQLSVQKRRAIDILNDMTDKGVIQRIGVNRSTAYVVQRGAQQSREVIDTL